MWDSGEVASGATHLIGYPADAPPLRSDTRYYWVVRCLLDDGTNAESAAAASFTTGLLAPSAWLATWIRTDAAIGAPLFRREFTLPALPALHTPHAPWPPNSIAVAAAPPRVTLFVAGIGYNEVCSTGSNLYNPIPPLCPRSPRPSTRAPYPTRPLTAPSTRTPSTFTCTCTHTTPDLPQWRKAGRRATRLGLVRLWQVRALLHYATRHSRATLCTRACDPTHLILQPHVLGACYIRPTTSPRT